MTMTWLECVLRKLSKPYAGKPKHGGLYDGFVEAIESGVLKPGQKLPTETALAELLPVSIGTIIGAVIRFRTGITIPVMRVFYIFEQLPACARHLLALFSSLGAGAGTLFENSDPLLQRFHFVAYVF
jgi:hypothetical protein